MSNEYGDRVNGLIVKPPRNGAPDFVKMCLSFKVEEFITYLKQHNNNGWVNIDVNRSKGYGTKPPTLYPKLNDWKPKIQQAPSQDSQYNYGNGSNGPYGSAQDNGPKKFEDDIPF